MARFSAIDGNFSVNSRIDVLMRPISFGTNGYPINDFQCTSKYGKKANEMKFKLKLTYIFHLRARTPFVHRVTLSVSSRLVNVD